MQMLETIADKFAQDVLAAAEETGDETLVDKVADAVGTASPTFQEAFMTALRMRRAELRGRQALERLLAGRTKPQD